MEKSYRSDRRDAHLPRTGPVPALPPSLRFTDEVVGLILGICTLLLVFMWPMPSLKDESGLLVGVFRLAFITGGVVLIGPASYGWGALVGVCFTTAWFISTDKREG